MPKKLLNLPVRILNLCLHLSRNQPPSLSLLMVMGRGRWVWRICQQLYGRHDSERWVLLKPCPRVSLQRLILPMVWLPVKCLHLGLTRTDFRKHIWNHVDELWWIWIYIFCYVWCSCSVYVDNHGYIEAYLPCSGCRGDHTGWISQEGSGLGTDLTLSLTWFPCIVGYISELVNFHIYEIFINFLLDVWWSVENNKHGMPKFIAQPGSDWLVWRWLGPWWWNAHGPAGGIHDAPVGVESCFTYGWLIAYDNMFKRCILKDYMDDHIWPCALFCDNSMESWET